MSNPLSIATLIADRCREVGLSRDDLVRRCGYANVAKGVRRLNDLCAGTLRGTDWLVSRLPTALGVAPAVIETAIQDTRAELRARDEAAHRAADADYRRSFVPHGVILTDREMPEPIFVSAFIGVDRLLRIELDTTRDRSTFPEQAVVELKRRLRGKSGRAIPAFGNATGFIINYTPDRAVRFDLDGHAVEVLPGVVRLKQATLMVGGRPRPVLVDHLPTT